MTVAAATRLKLRHFQLIVAIEETGSLRKAADSLGITQPAASNTLQELEYILDVPLFTRSRTGTEPTAFGRRLVERGRQLLSNVRATAEEVVQIKNGDVGRVSVGILPASALTIVPLAIRLAHRAKPGLTVHVIEGATGQLLPALTRGELDIVVGRIPAATIPPHIDTESLLAEPNEIFCRAGHPLLAGRRPTLEALVDVPWILPDEGSYLRTDFRASFLEAGLVPPEPSVVTSSTILRRMLIETTDMLGMLTRRAAFMGGEPALRVVDVPLLRHTAPTLLLTRTDAIATPVTAAFSGFIRKATELLAEHGEGALAAGA